MHILVDIDGVLRSRNSDPISTGVQMVGALSGWNQMSFMTSESEAAAKQWLDINKIVDYDRLIDSSVGLVGEDLAQRQINFARSRGAIDLFITNDPSRWAFAFDEGIPSVMFGVPSYTRPEFRPDAPPKLRAWNDIERAIEEQNAQRTNDARISRTEALNFE